MPIASARWRARGFETPASPAPWRVCVLRPFLERLALVGPVGDRVAPVKVFVTGGTGFIGGEVVRQLRERGDEVACLVRTPEKGQKVADLGCELVAGDLGDSKAIRDGMEGCDAVIHAAAMYEVGIPASQRPAMREANVGGTERVLRRRAGGEDPQDRLRLHRRHLRQHRRQGRRRVLRAPRQGLHLLLRGDQVGGPPDRQADDRRRGPALRDRPAGRRLRPRRHLLDRRAARPVPLRQDAADALPRAGHLPLPRRRHRRRGSSSRSTRACRARPTSSAAR